MPYYKDGADSVYFFSDPPGSLARDDLVEITEVLANELLAANTVAPAIPPVTRRQARLALLGAGLLDNVETALNALPSPQKEAALIEWVDALQFERDHPLIAAMTQALGLTEAQVDDLFKAAAVL